MKYLFTKPIILAIAGLLAVTSCSDSKDEIDDQFIQTAHIVKGKVEKGPLVSGSTVEMRTLDKDMTPTGASYTTTIENNTGDFNYGSLKMNSPYAKLTADGYFFNEVDGELSTSTIKLNAIVDLSDNSTINVNIVTHLKSQRIVYLVTSKGMSFADANKQAQKELMTAFALQDYATKDASQYSIIAGDDAAGALIAISSYVLSDRSEAEIVEFLSKLTNEFSSTGTFTDSTKEQLKKTKNYLNGKLEDINQNIVNRYKELDYNVSVKDLAYYFDWDNDGIAGNEIDGNSTVELSQSQITVPMEGGDYTITVKSDKQYYFEAPSTTTDGDSFESITPGGSVNEDTYFSSLYENGYVIKNMEYSKEIEGNTIKVHVAPAQFKAQKSVSFPLFNARGKQVAEITITQDGNPNMKSDRVNLGNDGANAVSYAFSCFRDAMAKVYQLEGNYSLQTNHTPFRADDSGISNAWQMFYKSLNLMSTIKRVDANALGYYQEYLNTYFALAYYAMTAYWGGVPYITEFGVDVAQNIARTSEQELLTQLAVSLKEAMPSLDEKKNESLSNVNDALFVSKDVARVVLAYVYMNQKNYSEAQSLLEKVVNNGYYSLENTTLSKYANNSECILGLAVQTRSGESVHPCLDYKDVILSLAECYYYNNNTSKAKQEIDEYCSKKSLNIDKTDIIKAIATLRYKTQTPFFLSFIRRNNLGGSFLGLADAQLYQLLWPLPSSDLNYNPQLTQNPGY